jgi:hypothetical protein
VHTDPCFREQKFGLLVKTALKHIDGVGTNAIMAASSASPDITVHPALTSEETDGMWTSGSKILPSIALGAAVSATSVATAQATPIHAMGRCLVAETITVGTDAPGVEIGPTVDADSYVTDYQSEITSPLKKYSTDKYSFDGAATKILTAPKHGKVILDPNTGPNISAAEEGWYYYVSNKGFAGEDTFAIQVNKYGLKINIQYTIEVPADNESPKGLCPWDQMKISRIEIEDTNGTTLASTIFIPDVPFQPASLPAYLANVTFNLPNSRIGVSDLAGAAVGQESTTGTTTAITLDTNAAGYGWFIDQTPADNSEFLPTSNPNEWVAKVGSPAYGTMDLYTVLLREYGHALGLDHSPDSHDFMAANLRVRVHFNLA